MKLAQLLGLFAALACGVFLLTQLGGDPASGEVAARTTVERTTSPPEDSELAAVELGRGAAPSDARTDASVSQEPPAAAVEVAPPHDDEAADGRAHVVGCLLLPGGAPAAGAALEISGWGGNTERLLKHGRPDHWSDITGETDEDGRFDLAFDAPLAFQFTLDASIPGHAALSWRWGSLPQGERTDVGTQTFAAAGTIVGRIERKGGEPAGAGWQIYAEASVRASGSDSDPTRVSEAADGTTGAFRLEGLPPGSTELKAYHRSANWIDGPNVVVKAGTETEAVIVYEGEDLSRRISISTSCRPFHVFSNPVNGRMVLRSASGEETEIVRIKGSSQSYSVDNVAPGEYTVEIESDVHAPWSQSGVRPGDRVRAKLVGTAAAALEVLDAETGEPVSRYALQVRFEDANFSPNSFGLLTQKSEPPTGGLFEGLIARNCTFVVESDGYARTDVPVGELVPGATRSVSVALTRGTLVRASVRNADGTPANNVKVTLHPYHEGYDPSDPFSGPNGMSARSAFRAATREVALGPDGRCEFSAVGAGEWAVDAAVGPLRIRSGKLKITGDGTQDVALELPGAGSLAGKIRFEDGADLTGLFAFVYPKSGPRPKLPWTGTSPNLVPLGASGGFEMQNLTAEVHTVALCVPSRMVPSSSSSSGGTGPAFKEIGEVLVRSGAATRETFDATAQSPCWIEMNARVGGEPGAGLVFWAMVDGGRERLGGVLDAGGALKLGPLFPGNYDVMLRPLSGEWRWERSENLTLAAGGTTELPVEIEIGSGSVRVLDAATGKPAASMTVWVDGSQSAKTDADGRLQLVLTVGSHEFLGGDENFFAAALGESAPSAGVTLDWGPEGPVVDTIRLSFDE